MTQRIVEPVSIGLDGILRIEKEGAVFEPDSGDPVNLGDFAEAGRDGLAVGDVLRGRLQCYRGWVAQDEAVAGRWLRQKRKVEPGNDALRETRAVFRVMDFEKKDGCAGSSMELRERKRFLDAHIRDSATVQKNPYLVLAEADVEGFISEQPEKSRWLVRSVDDRGDLRGSRCGSQPGGHKSGSDKREESLPMEIRLAGGWVDGAEVETRLEELHKQVCEREESNRVLSDMVREYREVLEQRQPLVKAGQRYLELLKQRGERCLRVLQVQQDSEEDVQRLSELFDSGWECVEQLESRVRSLESRLEHEFPVEALSRAGQLDLPQAGARFSEEDFQIR
jgi:hypothetical protein